VNIFFLYHYRKQRHGHMGTAHEALASQRDPPRNTSRKGEKELV